jgi:hypothetical protein
MNSWTAKFCISQKMIKEQVSNAYTWCQTKVQNDSFELTWPNTLTLPEILRNILSPKCWKFQNILIPDFIQITETETSHFILHIGKEENKSPGSQTCKQLFDQL